MAVTVTRAQLAARMRLGRTQTELDETGRIVGRSYRGRDPLGSQRAGRDSQHGRLALLFLCL